SNADDVERRSHLRRPAGGRDWNLHVPYRVGLANDRRDLYDKRHRAPLISKIAQLPNTPPATGGVFLSQAFTNLASLRNFAAWADFFCFTCLFEGNASAEPNEVPFSDRAFR